MLLAIGNWVKSLLVVALLGNVVELVLPEGSFRRYAGLVVGLVMLAAILAPLRSFFSGSRALPEINWQTPAGASSYDQLLNGEEVRSVEAILDNYPGVTRVNVVLQGSAASVTVWADRRLDKNFTAYAKAALQAVVASNVQVRIQIVGQTSPSVSGASG